jgi:DNA-binding PadR family transcriptional regulator
MASIKNSQNKYSIVRSSSTETILNFLYIFSKTKVYGDPTIEDLVSYAPNKLKRPEALEKNFQRLLSNKYITSYKKNGQVRYQITDLGKQVVFEFASDRRLKRIKSGKTED